jgi:uncharacterized protein YjbI with pentapeptide repeats
MTAAAGTTPSHDVLAPTVQAVIAQEAARRNQPGGRHSAHVERRISRRTSNGIGPASREPRSNATATLLRQTASRQRRLRLTQPAHPVRRSRWRREVSRVKGNLVKLFARLDWTKVGAFVTAVGAVATILISIGSLGSTIKQNSLTAKSQLSDRLNKAIGYLDSGKNARDVVVGGIYSLEQLSQDDLADDNLRMVVFDVLDTYVTNHSPKDCPKFAAPSGLTPPSPDVKAALTVIGRRKFQQKIDLSNACLIAVDLKEARLDNAWLSSTTLTGATLAGANLASADLSRAVLKNAYLGKTQKNGKERKETHTNLTDASLTDANLTDADLTGADLTGADLTGADLTRAHLTSANLRGVRYSESTRWPDGFTPPPSRVLP